MLTMQKNAVYYVHKLNCNAYYVKLQCVLRKNTMRSTQNYNSYYTKLQANYVLYYKRTQLHYDTLHYATFPILLTPTVCNYMWLGLENLTIWVQTNHPYFSSWLYHTLIYICTTTTKSLSLLQNLMGFLLQFTEMRYFILKGRYVLAKTRLSIICALMVNFRRPSHI